MARRKTTEGGLTKAAAIRDILRTDPDIKPQEGIALVKERHGIDVTTNVFSMYRGKEKMKPAVKPDRRGRKKSGDAPLTLEDLLKAKTMIEEFGGLNRLHQAVAALAKLS